MFIREEMSLLATKVYRPETVSIAGRTTPTDPETLRTWWGWGTDTQYNAATDAQSIAARSALRKGEFIVTAKPRSGYYVLEARSTD